MTDDEVLIMERLRVNENGHILCTVDHVEYVVTPKEMLETNIKSCIKQHKDTLLEVWSYLYGAK